MDILARLATDVLPDDVQQAAEALYTQANQRGVEARELEMRAEALRAQAHPLHKQRAALLGATYYDLKPGDAVEVTEDGWRGPITYRLRVTGFSIPHGATGMPDIKGTMIRANGAGGETSCLVAPSAVVRLVKLTEEEASKPRRSRI